MKRNVLQQILMALFCLTATLVVTSCASDDLADAVVIDGTALQSIVFDAGHADRKIVLTAGQPSVIGYTVTPTSLAPVIASHHSGQLSFSIGRTSSQPTSSIAIIGVTATNDGRLSITATHDGFENGKNYALSLLYDDGTARYATNYIPVEVVERPIVLSLPISPDDVSQTRAE